MKLFYVPHAGGTASSMNKWSGELADVIEPVPIEFSGRGSRYNEEPYTDLMDAVEDIFGIFKELADGENYVLAGHSMGATLIYELYYKILGEHLKLPVHMFFSGSKPPYTRKKSEIIHTLDDDLFLNEIRKYGGLSDEIFNIDKFSKIFTPLLKADYRLIENYKATKKKRKIECPISIMYGDEDLTYEEVNGWENLACKCYFEAFHGGHFYMNFNPAVFASYINRRIREE